MGLFAPVGGQLKVPTASQTSAVLGKPRDNRAVFGPLWTWFASDFSAECERCRPLIKNCVERPKGSASWRRGEWGRQAMLRGMRFTEHELTAALTGAAKSLLASRKDVRKRGVDIDTAWEAMGRYERFQLLDLLGDQILPVLVALPDVDVAPGTRPSYSTKQVGQVVAGLVEDEQSRLRRAVMVKARTALVQTALAHVPPRIDPDALGISNGS